MTTGGALFAIVWGLGATIMGILAATDYRGFIDAVVRTRRRSFPGGAFPPPAGPSPARRAATRFAGVVFTVAGPIALVAGVVSLATHPWRVNPEDLRPHLNPLGVVGGVGIVVGIVRLWLPRTGALRRAWDQAGIARVAAVEVTCALLVALAGWTTMIPAIFMTGWALGLPGAVALALTHRRGRTGEGQGPYGS
jgi:hypothetical protein